MSDQLRDQALGHEIYDPLFHSMSAYLRHYNGDDVNAPPFSICRVPPSAPPFSICRVPPSVRNVDPNAYEPEVIYIGPYHRQNPKLHAMEEHKWRYMHKLLGRCRSSTADQSEVLKHCIRKVRSSEERARRCYKEHNFCFSSNNNFVMALVLDGCFILELFLTFYIRDFHIHDLIHTLPWMFSAISRDLLKLENQIPFFILQDLFDTTIKNAHIISLSLDELTFRYLMNGCLTLTVSDRFELHKTLKAFDICYQKIKDDTIYHLLHFYHMLLRPSTSTSTSTTCDDDHAGTSGIYNLLPRYCSSAMTMFFEKVKKNLMPHIPHRIDDRRRPDNTMIHCVGKLCDDGITVSLRKPETQNAVCAILDVAFKDGVLHVPRLSVDDDANTFFRNLLALELFCPDNNRHVTYYTIFLDRIVNTAKDVTILEQRGIINNMLGSEEEVAQLINQLGKGLPFSPESNYLQKVFTEVNDYCESKWHKHRASWVRDYFSSPWSAISLLAAVALLLLTLIQVVYAIISYIKQKN